MYKIEIKKKDDIVINNGFTREELESIEKSLTILVESYEENLDDLAKIQRSDVTNEEYKETQEAFYETFKDEYACNSLLSIIRKNLE